MHLLAYALRFLGFISSGALIGALSAVGYAGAQPHWNSIFDWQGLFIIALSILIAASSFFESTRFPSRF